MVHPDQYEFVENIHKHPILTCLVNNELYCANVKTFEILHFTFNKELEYKQSFNLKEMILSKYTSNTIDGNEIFNEETLMWDFLNYDNSFIAVLYNVNNNVINNYVVKFNNQSIEFIVGDELYSRYGICIKQDTIYGIDKTGCIVGFLTVSGEYGQCGVYITHESDTPPDHNYNYQISHFQNRFIYPSLSQTRKYSSTFLLLDDNEDKIIPSRHAISYPFPTFEKEKTIQCYSIDKTRGLVFSIANPGPFSSICITHLYSSYQLFTMAPLFFSTKYSKIETMDQKLIITSINDKNQLTFHLYEYGRYTVENLIQERLKNIEIFKSMNFFSPSDQEFIKSQIESKLADYSKEMKKPEVDETSRRNNNLVLIEREIFEFGKLVTAKPQSELEEFKVEHSMEQKNKKMSQLVLLLRNSNIQL